MALFRCFIYESGGAIALDCPRLSNPRWRDAGLYASSQCGPHSACSYALYSVRLRALYVVRPRALYSVRSRALYVVRPRALYAVRPRALYLVCVRTCNL